MAEKQSENISLEDLQKSTNALEGQFRLLLLRTNRMDVKLDKIDAEQRKIAVLFEHTESGFKLTLDGYAAVNRKIEKLEARMEALETRMERLEIIMKEGFELLLQKLDQKADRVLR